MKNSDLHICGSLYVQANATFLNGLGTEKSGVSDVTWPKYIDLDGRRIPYVAAQAYRYWLKNTVTQEFEFSAQKFPQLRKHTDPIINPMDDLFGYFLGHNIEIPEDGRIDANAAIIRESPLKISPLIAISDSNLQFTRENAFVHLQNDTPVPYSSEFYNADLESMFGIRVGRIGTYACYNDRQEISPDPAKVSQKLQQIENTPAKRVYRLDDYADQVIPRLYMLLAGMMLVNGGAKATQYGADVSPKAVVAAVQKGGNPILSQLVKPSSGGPIFDTDLCVDRIQQGIKMDLFESPVYIAFRKNYFCNEGEVMKFPERMKEITKKSIVELTTPLQLTDQIMASIRIK